MFKKLVFVAVILSFITAQSTLAQTISINPKRVVFAGSDLVKEVHLHNPSEEETVYRIYFEETVMNESGSVEVLKGDIPASHNSAKSIVSYSPNKVTIPALGSQTVSLKLNKKADIADGEYRSNIVFKNVPKDSIYKQNSQNDANTTHIFGISIPVIVRHGELNATAKITDLQLNQNEEGQHIASMTLHREGSRSLYGHFIINYTDPDNGTTTKLAAVKGIAVYNNVESRPVSIKLQIPEGTTITPGGTISVHFTEDRDMSGNATAEQSITIL